MSVDSTVTLHVASAMLRAMSVQESPLMMGFQFLSGTPSLCRLAGTNANVLLTRHQPSFPRVVFYRLFLLIRQK